MDNHVKKNANDLIHLLLHKSPAIPALQPKYSRQVLIRLSQVLKRDNLLNIITISTLILQQLTSIPTIDITYTDITSKSATIRNTTLDILSPTIASNVVALWNTTSKGKKKNHLIILLLILTNHLNTF